MTYVLVHGAWEGAWSWEAVTPQLKQRGHDAVAVDLPGSYGNMKPIRDVSMESYVSTVVDAIGQLDGKVVLAGHSLGGAVISAVAERVPERIERLIYVAAFLLKSGVNVLETMQSDESGELLPKLVFSEDQSYAMVPEEVWRQVALHDCEAEQIDRALPRLAERQATEPFMAEVDLSEARFGAVPKTFIRAALDKIATPQLQDRMIDNWPVEKVTNLESGHFPALAIPENLASAML